MRLSQMGRQGRLAGYVEQLPKTYEAEGSVGCSWKEMGRVMRSLVETERSDRVELMDGVKVRSDKGWVLIRPNGDLTAYRVVAGSFNGEYAQERAAKQEIRSDFLQGMIYIFVRACVHFALFEDEEYLSFQLNTIRTSLGLYIKDVTE